MTDDEIFKAAIKIAEKYAGKANEEACIKEIYSLAESAKYNVSRETDDADCGCDFESADGCDVDFTVASLTDDEELPEAIGGIASEVA